MTRKPTPARLAPAALILSALLLGCNQQGTAPPTGGVNALVLGSVQSPYLDTLKPNLNLVQYTGSQKVDDYDLIVFDGDAQSPQTLQADPLVERALRSGKWVLGLDVSEAHQRTGLGDRLGFVTRSTSPGWLVRMARDESGHPAMWIVDAPTGQEALTTTPFPAGILGDPAAQLSASTNAYADLVMSRLRAPLTGVRDTPIPSDLIMKTYFYTPTTPYTFTGTYRGPGQQTSTAQDNFTFNVYLDNSNNPQGNFQWVEVNSDVTANPTSGAGTFAAMNMLEKAWFLDKQTVSVRPSAAADALFTSYGSSPATANGVTEVTTGPRARPSRWTSPTTAGPTPATYTNRKYQPLSPVSCTHNVSFGSPCRAASLKHGLRGWLTCTMACSIWYTSPMHASSSVSPLVVKFSPNAASPRGLPSRSCQEG